MSKSSDEEIEEMLEQLRKDYPDEEEFEQVKREIRMWALEDTMTYILEKSNLWNEETEKALNEAIRHMYDTNGEGLF